MEKGCFAEQISAMPAAQAKQCLVMARIGVGVLFVTMLVTTGVAGWFLITEPNRVLPAVILVALWTGAFFGGRLHREVYEAGNSLQPDHVCFEFEIPENELVAIPYSPQCGIIKLAECLIDGQPFEGFIQYRSVTLPNTSVPVAFLEQRCVSVADQLNRIKSTIQEGALLILIPNMEEGLAPDDARVLRNSVQALCKAEGVTVVNEVYHETDLQNYDCTYRLGN